MEEIIGIIAATLTTLCFVPQVIQVLKTRDTKGISLAMYITFVLGVSMWCVYGILIGKWPVIIANIATFILASIILYIKIKEG